MPLCKGMIKLSVADHSLVTKKNVAVKRANEFGHQYRRAVSELLVMYTNKVTARDLTAVYGEAYLRTNRLKG